MRSNGFAVESFPIPGMRPPEVEKAAAKFNELVAEMNEVVSEWSARKQSYDLDLAAAHRAQAEARVNGTKATGPTPAEVESNVARLAAERESLMAAVDVAGSALAEAVAEHHERWLADARSTEATGTQQLDVALDEVEKVCRALHESRQAIPWLESFDLGRALRGESLHMTGGIGNYRTQIAELRELVEGPKPKHIGWRTDGEGHSEPIYETKDRLGRSFSSVR